MADETPRERVLRMLRELRDQRGWHALNCEQLGNPGGAVDALEEVEELDLAISALSTPDPAVMSDEELRAECERLAAFSGPIDTEIGSGYVRMYASVNMREGACLDARNRRTALLALHAALTVLAQEGGE